MAMKRKRCDLSLGDKYEAVKLLDQKISQTEVAKKLGCSQSQICRISAKRENIRSMFESNANPARKRQKSGKAADVEGALTDWFEQARVKDIPLSGPILAEKAKDLAKHLDKEDFNLTTGWLSRWKKTNNIVYKKLHGEKKDADINAADNWTTTVLPGLLQKYAPDDIYNADETGVYYRALPDGTLTKKRRHVVKKIIDDIDRDTDITANELVKKLTILDTIQLARSWKAVTETTIRNCYRKGGFTTPETTTSDEHEEINPLPGMTDEEFTEYVNKDEQLECYTMPTDEEICSKFRPPQQKTASDDSDNDDEEFVLPVTAGEARSALSTLRRYFGESNCDHFELLYKLEDMCEATAANNRWQTKITEHINWIP
ncbi:tigger transposable element-derived protein 6-like [Gigantopelta aegis]|uniref:tigger transposable element-derived protein 6-like n=1 Tax=Gigantopelta aegis TaxID=1735272 RepID=UPI001B887552|nr:tigger transposable element-derived protein 6-like [Gigantopelta aegis]